MKLRNACSRNDHPNQPHLEHLGKKMKATQPNPRIPKSANRTNNPNVQNTGHALRLCITNCRLSSCYSAVLPCVIEKDDFSICDSKLF